MDLSVMKCSVALQVTYGDYEGEALEDDDNIRPVRTSFSYNIKDNFALFMAICLLIYLN